MYTHAEPARRASRAPAEPAPLAVSPQAAQLQALQELADAQAGRESVARGTAPVQRAMPEEEEPLQGRFGTPGFGALQAMADAYAARSSVAQLQAMADASAAQDPIAQLAARYSAPVQRATPEDDELLQGKFEAVQRVGPEDEEPLQGRFETVQRVGLEEDEEPLQGRFETVQRAQARPEPNRTGLPDHLKAGVESLSGLSMDPVRVHYNSNQPAQLNALAYTQGTNIYVGPGQERHLGHEAWHVVQQAQGRVRATRQMMGVGVNDEVGLEGEAERMGTRAAQRPREGAGSNSSLAPFSIAPFPLHVSQMRGEQKLVNPGPASPHKPFTSYKYMGKVILEGAPKDVWWDPITATYRGSEGGTIAGIRSERYYAEGLGLQSFDRAEHAWKKEDPTLVKGTEYEELDKMPPLWKHRLDHDITHAMEKRAPNFRFNTGGTTGNLLNKYKLAGRTGHSRRQHDLMQITFGKIQPMDKATIVEERKRGELEKYAQKGDHEYTDDEFSKTPKDLNVYQSDKLLNRARDTRLLEGFLDTAKHRLKESGEAVMVTMNTHDMRIVLSNAIKRKCKDGWAVSRIVYFRPKSIVESPDTLESEGYDSDEIDIIVSHYMQVNFAATQFQEWATKLRPAPAIEMKEELYDEQACFKSHKAFEGPAGEKIDANFKHQQTGMMSRPAQESTCGDIEVHFVRVPPERR